MAESTSKTYWKILIALSLVHFSGDFYSAFISPLFPVFMDKMGLFREWGQTLIID